ncbi:hypothetical protein RF11_04962 [Thelohanellus kitauei]|uniref:Sortilin N-terminal domain-containing protein n=1 Tax=Thelohanellus kitauei TaxID=669202 RepID=A0A0C2J9N2_THEKT|nr:hypothetical protein RF11_04962 [Thelohanellus kitauei]
MISEYEDIAIFYQIRNELFLLEYENVIDLNNTLNEDDQIIPIICDLFIYDPTIDKCPFILNPHIPCVIYANCQTGVNQTSTYVSLDNGKTFQPLELEGEFSKYFNNTGRIELDFDCRKILTKNYFPDISIVRFNGTFYQNNYTTRHIFVSFNEGKS